MLSSGENSLRGEDQYFAGFYVSNKTCACRVQGTTLGGNYITAISRLSVTQRSEAIGIPCADQFLRRHDHK